MATKLFLDPISVAGTIAATGAITGSNLSGTNTGDQTLPTRASLGLATTDSPTFAGLTLTKTSGALSFIGKIGTTGDYAQFGFQNPAGSQRGYFGYIGATFGNANRADHFEIGTTTSTNIYLRPGDGDSQQITIYSSGGIALCGTSVVDPGAGNLYLSGGLINIPAATSYRFQVAATDQMRLYPSGGLFVGASPSDPAAGNIGLGAVPAYALHSTFVGLLMANGNVFSTKAIGASAVIGMAQNLIQYTSAALQLKYISSDVGSVYYQQAGSHIWGSATTGTAGNSAISNTTYTMTLYPSGGLYIGAIPGDPGTNNLVVQGGLVVGGTIVSISSIQGSVLTASSSGSTFAQPAFIAPTLLNSWVNYASGYINAGYTIDSMGFVHLRGFIKSGTTAAGVVLFTLPAGYRPTATEVFITDSNSTFGEIQILSTGDVKLYNGNTTFVSLSGITFRIT